MGTCRRGSITKEGGDPSPRGSEVLVSSISGLVVLSLQKYNRENLHEVVGVSGSSHVHSA